MKGLDESIQSVYCKCFGLIKMKDRWLMLCNNLNNLDLWLWMIPMIIQWIVYCEKMCDIGENGQITHFCKLYFNLPLFGKYIAIYHFFSTRV